MESVPVAGSRAGRYLLLRQLTQGFVGSLLEARCEGEQEQQLLALARVIKLPAGIHPDTEQSLAEAAWDSMELDDESVVRVADVVFGTGWFALVHDHYEGDTVRTMQRRIAERKSAMPVPVALRLILDTLEAVRRVAACIEDLGIPYASVTVDPGSLLVCDDGRTRLLDGFVGQVVGGIPNFGRDVEALAYAAPEQFAENAPTNALSDVFRLGIVAWELLSTKRLLTGSRQAMERRLSHPIIRADRVVRVGTKVPEAVAQVVEKALSLDPAQRFASVAEFEQALRAAADKIASQEEVIQFADALVGRESTLARLVMDRPPRLSDAMKSVRPTADVTKSFAAHVRGGNERARAAAAVTRQAPDAMFHALPRVQQPPRVLPPEPTRRTAPPPVRVPGLTNVPAAGPQGRARFNTLVGLSDELAAPLPTQGLPLAPTAARTPSQAPIAPSSSVAIAEPTTAIVDTIADDQDQDDGPTQTYSIAHVAEMAEAKARERMESGPRLASSPPPALDAPTLRDPSPAPAASTKATQAVNWEETLRAADNGVYRDMAAAGGASFAAPVQEAGAFQQALPAAHAQAEAQPSPGPHPSTQAHAQRDRRLLALTLLFASTTVVLGVLVIGLLARSSAAEQAASALATAPVVQTRTSQPEAPSKPAAVVAPRPVAEPVAAARVVSEPASATKTEAEPEAEATEAEPAEDASVAAEAAAPAAAQAPAPPRARPRPRKKAAKRYVPNDI